MLTYRVLDFIPTPKKHNPNTNNFGRYAKFDSLKGVFVSFSLCEKLLLIVIRGTRYKGFV